MSIQLGHVITNPDEAIRQKAEIPVLWPFAKLLNGFGSHRYDNFSSAVAINVILI